MQGLVEHARNLREVGVPFHEGAAQLAELIALFLIQVIVFFLHRQQGVRDGSLGLIVLACVLIKIDFIDILDIAFIIKLIFMEHLLNLVDGIRIDFLLKVCLLIERLESFQNFLLGVDEIQNEGIFLVRVAAVQAG